jgi:Cu-Zn family superoxide dismutase
MKDIFFKPVLLSVALGLSAGAHASYTVRMNLVDADGVGKSIGKVTISESEYGTVFTPDLKDLPPGKTLGFHVHENDDCGPAAKDEIAKREPGEAAGSHYDPDKTKHHGGPMREDSHRGDLPALSVAKDGTATQPVVAPRLKLKETEGKSLVVHLHGDNYSDKPKPSGGSGKRIACGIVKAD